MAEKLIVEWDRGRLIAATGSPGAGGVRIDSALVVDKGEEGQLLPSEIGERLKSALSVSAVAVSEAIAVFPRELVTFHRLSLPNLPDDELPDIVRLQAATRLTAAVDTVCLDFSPLPVTAGSDTRDVLLVTVPRQHVADVREALGVCEIELAGVRVSSFGIAASVVDAGLTNRSAEPDSVEAVVSLGSDSIEMIFLQNDYVAFSHSGASWTSLDRVEQAVRAEVSRARMAAAEDIGEYTVDRLTLIGSDRIAGAVPDSITRRLNDAAVERVEPEGRLVSGPLPEGLNASDMLAIAGTIANAKATAVQAVDLINPRKAAEKKDYSRLIRIAVGGGLALALIAVWSWRSGKIQALESETSALKSDTQDMRDELKLAKNELILNARLTEWSDRDISWVGQLMKVQQLMEGTERLFIRSVQANAERKGDQLGAIKIEGYAKDRRDIEDFARVLNDAGYDVSPTEMPPNPRDPDYAYEMSLEVIIPVVKETSKKSKV